MADKSRKKVYFQIKRNLPGKKDEKRTSFRLHKHCCYLLIEVVPKFDDIVIQIENKWLYSQRP